MNTKELKPYFLLITYAAALISCRKYGRPSEPLS